MSVHTPQPPLRKWLIVSYARGCLLAGLGCPWKQLPAVSFLGLFLACTSSSNGFELPAKALLPAGLLLLCLTPPSMNLLRQQFFFFPPLGSVFQECVCLKGIYDIYFHWLHLARLLWTFSSGTRQLGLACPCWEAACFSVFVKTRNWICWKLRQGSTRSLLSPSSALVVLGLLAALHHPSLHFPHGLSGKFNWVSLPG